MEYNDRVRRPAKLLAVVLGTALCAGCGGPAAVLHDVLDEGEERVERVLEIREETEDEMSEAIAIELPPCPAEYQPPPFAENPPPYADIVERPAELPEPSEWNETRRTHRTTCENANAALQAIPRILEEGQRQLEDFSGYADAMRSFIDDDMADDEVEALSAAIDAIVRARPEGEDTLQLRYQRLNTRLLEMSPLVREMAQGTRRPGSRVNPGGIPDLTVRENVESIRAPWMSIIDAHADAQAFFEIANENRRRIYEGPDAEDPEEAAAGWNPLSGVWTGESGRTGTILSGRRDRVTVTFEAAGEVILHYPDSECGGPLELTSTSGASGRITEYRETGGRACRRNATVRLERTAEDRIRFAWERYDVGNLTPR